MLLLLLLLPFLIAVAGFLLSKGKIHWKEFLAQLAVQTFVIVVGYYIALHANEADVEIWNGVVVKKWADTGSCCHSYPCNCRQECSGSGKDRSCSEVCDTCYQHSRDDEWWATASTGDTVFQDTCNSPGSSAPSRWEAIVVGEPASVERRYTNYIKGNPDTVLRRIGAKEKFPGLLPSYPGVYDLYRFSPVVSVGVEVPGLRDANTMLHQANGNIGAVKQVNMLLVLVNTPDAMYVEALREHWLGGKKNDFIVVMGLTTPPKISWVGTVSWSDSEELKIIVRDRLLELGTWEPKKVIEIISREVNNRFQRKPMSDFQYLAETAEPSSTATTVLFIIGALLAIGLKLYFICHDPFETEPRRNRYGY